jgi:hypothetical protein
MFIEIDVLDVYKGQFLDYFCVGVVYSGRRFDSHRGRAYFSSSPGVDIHSRVTSQTSVELAVYKIQQHDHIVYLVY